MIEYDFSSWLALGDDVEVEKETSYGFFFSHNSQTEYKSK